MISKNEADAGFTDNANLTSDNKESDMFLRVATSNRFLGGQDTYSFRLAYIAYTEQRNNDHFSLNLQKSWGDLKKTLYTAALIGQYYPNGNSGTTETAFNSFGGDFTLAKNWKPTRELPGEFGAGYRLRYYPSFEGRNDHTGFAYGTVTYSASRRLTLIGYGEAGPLWSSLPDYTRVFAEVTATAEYLLPNRWIWTSDFTLGRSYFLDRSVTTQTRVTNKSGRVKGTSSTSNERYTNISLSTEALRTQTDTFQWGGDASLSTQSSLSGNQNFSVFTVQAKAILNF